MLKVTQQQQIHQILNTILGKKPCSVIVEENEHPAGFVSYTLLSTGPEIKLRTQFSDSPAERRVLVRHNKKRIVAVCKFFLRNGQTEVLYPQSLEITDEVKPSAAPTKNSTEFFLTNLTSSREIAFVIEANKKKLDMQVLNFFDSELKSMVSYHKIFLAVGDVTDVKLRHLIKNPRIIYYTPEPPASFNARQFFPQDIYLAELQKTDLKVPQNLTTEFTIPILYKTRLPIGYIQVNALRPLEEAMVQTLKKMGVALETQLRKNGLVFEEPRALPLQEVDLKRVQLEINDRLLLRFFPEGSNNIFRIQKGQDNLGQFTAHVTVTKNLGSGKTQIIMAFDELDAMAEFNLEEALKVSA